MAGDAIPQSLTNGDSHTAKPLELAIPMPHAPGSHIRLHLTILATTILLFVTSTGYETAGGAAAMGSFVYAMPDV